MVCAKHGHVLRKELTYLERKGERDPVAVERAIIDQF
uniref:Transposase n=1 Tax=Heterorhabditis bacteriophora TaxID=37862 RepID=A0A1I7XSI7_HETBA